MDTIYMDNNATTCVDPLVFEAMQPYFCKKYGNPSSMHSFGGRVEKDIITAREQVAQLLRVKPHEIVFTSCGTESNNAAIRGILEANSKKRHIVVSRVEHPAVLSVCRQLTNKGYTLTEISVNKKGDLDLEELRSSLTDDTVLVSMMYANNETGVVFPIKKIAEILKEREIVFHCDAVQAVGKIELDLQKIPIDLLTISGHKLHAPKGIGVLFIREGVRTEPLLRGGHQEKNRRAGTENVPSIVGLGKAAAIAQAQIEEERDSVSILRDTLENGILKQVKGAYVNGNRNTRLPNTTNIGFEYVEGEAILLMLDQAHIAASSGSACTSGSLEPSHVLRAMNVPQEIIQGSIRFSLSRFTSEKEVAYVLEKIPFIIERLRDISPFGK
ncbi:cysteine desulfurase NifS [Chlamydiota bacterium]